MKEKQKFSLQLKGVKKKKVKWSSNKNSIATVKNGIVRAKKIGKATITAKALGKKYKCKIFVERKMNEGEKENKMSFSMFFTVEQIIDNTLYLVSETNPQAPCYILNMNNSIPLARPLSGMSFGKNDNNGVPATISDTNDLTIVTGTRLKIVNPNVVSSPDEDKRMEIIDCTMVNIIDEGHWFYTPLYVKQISKEFIYPTTLIQI